MTENKGNDNIDNKEEKVTDDQTEATNSANKENENSTSDNDGVELSETEKLAKELAEMKDKYLRLYSEFDNFRRRTAKEKLDLQKTASEKVLSAIIPTVDDLERAIANTKSDSPEVKPVVDGIVMIKDKMLKTLEGQGVKQMEDATGKPLNTDYHDAITQIPAPTEDLKGKIVDVVEKGYTLNDKVIRYAKVVVGQ
ncbi:nucleotide exchange factor GrpE [Flammeovirga kamogawensis]|uniref:Protein GrpE n=1 Tax=Flammeovirga kamogawensis TaxID=373891 RepID=A0ABX8GSH9_9BACT|nr:nucleotide exchange factor GrpE [Flammeovirga kamogawensis]MBB6463010.1 molecular chaperone GrpE [Flammeovirga kamogawensis]QWG06535.1 nucleotide exchange factor GrpE [Flammeovirga kamogawensis]TRX68363.1 nucleotide exchange factor GrpE [Flammeovirga kamogawensis]